MKKVLFEYNYDKQDWANLNVLERNRMDVRPFYCSYDNIEKALSFDRNQSSCFQSLNGDWKFRYLNSPFEIDESFCTLAFCDKDWDLIPVPSHWQMSGYGSHHYTDAESLFPVQKTPLIQTDNPTGIYRKKITIPKDDSREYILRFDGVESSFHLWVNGKPAGYSQVSRLPSEFNITSFLKDGENVISLKVYQFCDGSYLENQDMWWLAGIFRDVSLINRSPIHIKDYITSALPDRKLSHGDFSVSVEVENNSDKSSDINVAVTLLDGRKVLLNQKETLGIEPGKSLWVSLGGRVNNVHFWNSEDPYLYNTLLTLAVGEQPSHEICSLKTGFRRVEIEKGLIQVNGKDILFRGVNRHDWSPETGRAVTCEQMLQDLELMKKNNINAIRTAHYPNHPDFYDLCDELGFYVMDEADLECNQTYYWENPNQLSDDPSWENSYLDRIGRMVLRDRNHPCILFWSMGNESGYGRNMHSAYKHIKSLDSTRPVHYEEDREAVSADMFSTMYTNCDELDKLGYLEEEKPHLVCEYAHAMGNGPGGVKEYWEIFKKHPRLQGGFIWEWKDLSLLKTGNQGISYSTYGGDYHDSPNSGAFCCDGLVQADGRPTPGLTQFKKVLEQMRAEELDLIKGSVIIYNDYDFISLLGTRLVCTVSTPEKELLKNELELSDLPAGGSTEIRILTDLELKSIHDLGGEISVHLGFYRNPSIKSRVQEELAFSQFIVDLPLNKIEEIPSKEIFFKTFSVKERENSLHIQSDKLQIEYDRIHGYIQSFTWDEQSMIKGGYQMNFWRAPIDNDKNNLIHWKKYHVNNIQTSVKNVCVSEISKGVSIISEKVYAPIIMEWSIETREELQISHEGVLTLIITGTPKGKLPDSLPRLGMRFDLAEDLNQVCWYGRGPGDSYSDGKEGSPVGYFECGTDDFYFPYVLPQEHGNKSDVRWLFAGSDKDKGLCLTSDKGINFNISHYSREELEQASHTNELTRADNPILTLDIDQHGLGSASWGSDVLPPYILKPEKFHFTWVLCPVSKEDAARRAFEMSSRLKHSSGNGTAKS